VRRKKALDERCEVRLRLAKDATTMKPAHDEHGHGGHHGHGGRHGARQPERFDPARAALLDDPARFAYMPPAEILRLLDPPAGGTILDFGTGTGAYAIQIARARPDLKVIALDEQPEMLARMRSRPEAALPNIELALPDRLPGLFGRVERVLALNVLHELGDDALRDLARLPAAEGFVLVIDWNSDVDRPVGPPRDHTYNQREAIARLENLGFAAEALPPAKYHYVIRARRLNIDSRSRGST
jgi:SAM-dependent methyltransferase